jgi:hypothetical protein
LCGMGAMAVTREMLAAKFGSILPHLDERQRRLLMGAEARALGHGGIRLVARAAGVREATVRWALVSWRRAGSRWAGCGGRVGAAASGRGGPGPGPGAFGAGGAAGAG